MRKLVLLVVSAVATAFGSFSEAQQPPPPPFKEQFRLPWTRGSTDFVRDWVVAGPLDCKLDQDCLGGEGAVRPKAGDETPLPGGGAVKWRANRSWDDSGSVDGDGATAEKISYAFAKIPRAKAGKALVSLGSANGMRAWVNGRQIVARDGERAASPDTELVEMDLNAGDNALLIKVDSTSSFFARVLESGAVPDRLMEVSPSLIESRDNGFTLVTDASAARAAAEPVKIEALRAGGEIVFSATAKRGDQVAVDATRWADGPYEMRFSTPDARGLLFTTHLSWYKGDALAKARELAAQAAQADADTAEGATLKMLAHMVDDRLGVKVADAKVNAWREIHSPLMEYEELMLERAGKVGRVRAHGFVRLAWIDEIDHTPQFCRAYLPGGYSAAKKWPMVLELHGYNPANPVYWDWWNADSRHQGPNTEFPGHPGVIYVEPHGRGNVQYQSFGDADVLRCMAEARKLLSVDENRTYLSGNSMGGWGTWNVATRHPELFAAITPVFGGVDYHSQMSDEAAAKLSPAERYINEKNSSWSMAEGLIHTPIFVHHGDADEAVNVEWSRWGVRLLQRWGYDIRYREYPGKIHESLQASSGHMNIGWMLRHVRDPDPRKVRIRSGELRHAQAWWARVQQAERPMEFMLVDAEVMDRNLIRLDTDNVVAVTLTPSAKLVDVNRPVRVVWNGVGQDLKMVDGALRLTRAGYQPAGLRKSPSLPGATTDFFNTPFAVVIGTSSPDAAMRALIDSQAKAFIGAWKESQKFEPRVFRDTEISDADVARYSLMLIGGPRENAVTARLATKLPVRIAADRIVIDGRAFPVSDAAVQMLYPNPRNAQRYVWLFAATSTAGMNYAAPSPFRTHEWDYKIDDGTIPAPRQMEPEERTRVVSGSFDYNWRFNAAYLQMGDAEIRAKGRRLAVPGKGVKVDIALLDTYAGKYLLNGRELVLSRTGETLLAKLGPTELELVPLDQANFHGMKFNVWLTFEKDAAGKVTGFVGYDPDNGDFEGKKQ